jgi:hypothetical protein
MDPTGERHQTRLILHGQWGVQASQRIGWQRPDWLSVLN